MAERVVLVVDDDQDVRESTTELLVDMGFKAMSASSVTSALELLCTGMLPSVMLVDLEMPDMSGEELTRRCQADPDLAAIPVVFVSGNPEPAGLLERTGAAAFMCKPLQDELLQETLGRFV